MRDGNAIVPALPATRSGRSKPRLVVLLAFDGVEPLDISGPSTVFARANLMRPGTYDLVHAAPATATVSTTSGLMLTGLKPVETLRGKIDTLLIAGGDEAGLRRTIFEDGMPDWIRSRAPRIRRLGSICSGAFVLAATGLLDGRRAVTHWASCDLLAKLAPSIQVEADAIYVVDGPFYTSAGVTAGIDLALALVEEDLGREVASRVARDMVLFLRRSGGQSQYSVLLAGQASDGDSFADLISWIGEHPGSDLTVGALARRAGMSERTFMRAFLREIGSTPASLVRRMRVDCARRYLEMTVWPMKKVAEKAGFGSEDSLVRAFRSVLGATPETVRAGFKARPDRRS